jgi:ribonuclease BN (tRNA processing enzyme)
VVSGVGWGDERLVSWAQGADLLVHEAVYVPPPEDIEEAGVVADPERLRLEALIHSSLLDIGALATRANVDTLVLIKMRPPPMWDLQVTSHVGRTFSGRIVVAADGDEIVP